MTGRPSARPLVQAAGLVLGLPLALAALLAIWVFVPLPMAATSGAVLVLAGLLAARSRGPRTRPLALGLATVSGLLLAAELVCALAGRRGWPPVPPAWMPLRPLSLEETAALLPKDARAARPVPTFSSHRSFALGELVAFDERVGMLHLKDARARELRFSREHLVCDATYTTDANGLRTTTGPRGGPEAGAVLFLGDSFTFGACLDDNRTIASAYQEVVGRRARVFNLAGNGGSPQTALAMLEAPGFLREKGIGGRVSVAFLGVILHHLWRVRGDVLWRHFLPRYVLEGGRLARRGFFEPFPTAAPPAGGGVDGDARALSLREVLPLWVGHLALRSALVDRLVATALGPLPGTDLFLELVFRARDRLRHDTGAELVVFFWDDFGRSRAPVREALRRRGVRFLDVDELLPTFSPGTHRLPFYDHPSAVATSEAAASLARAFPLQPESLEPRSQ
jgi:hypothetical protein